jgi:hypothetical protein
MVAVLCDPELLVPLTGAPEPDRMLYGGLRVTLRAHLCKCQPLLSVVKPNFGDSDVDVSDVPCPHLTSELSDCEQSQHSSISLQLLPA